MSKISVIIPVYNAEDWLFETVRSVLDQTLTDFELILINDGSEDRSAEICDQFGAGDERVRVVHKKNEGPGVARNTGLELARGDYICFVDADDRITPSTLQDNLDIADRTGADLIIFGYEKRMVQGDRKVVHPSDLEGLHIESREELQSRLCGLIDRGARFSIWNKLFRAGMIEERNIRFPDLKRGQDMAFTMEYLKHCSSLVVNPEIYYHHNKRADEIKYDPDSVRVKVMLFNTFYHLYGDWMKLDDNYRTAVKIFNLWFAFTIPRNIISNKKFSVPDKFKALKEIFMNEDVAGYIRSFRLSRLKKMRTKIPVLVLKAKSPLLLYLFSVISILYYNVNVKKTVF